MKHLSIILAGICIILLNQGCDSGPDTYPGIGFIPSFKNNFIQTLNASDTLNLHAATTFYVNDYISFQFTGIDADLNIKTLYVTEYFPSDSYDNYNSTQTISLPEQLTEFMTYSNIGRRIITEPPGDYRLDLQIEDETGNKSDIVGVSIIVE
jgi:hypothetical protein